MNDHDEIMQRLDGIENKIDGNLSRPYQIDEAAKYLGVSRGHLYKLTCQSKIPFYKPNGKRIYFKKSELDNWIYSKRSVPMKEVRSHV